jgi:hypothetical protein
MNKLRENGFDVIVGKGIANFGGIVVRKDDTGIQIIVNDFNSIRHSFNVVYLDGDYRVSYDMKNWQVEDND